VALARKLTDAPGEQLLVYGPDGTVSLVADMDAADSPDALRRYAHPFYATGGQHISGL
jgi:hypothetical protein